MIGLGSDKNKFKSQYFSVCPRVPSPLLVDHFEAALVAGRSRHADFSGLSRAISLQPGEQVATTCQNRNWKTKPHSINFQLDRRVCLVKGILGWDDDTAGNDMEPVDEACCEAVAVADEVEALRPLIPSCPPPPHHPHYAGVHYTVVLVCGMYHFAPQQFLPAPSLFHLPRT